MPPGSLIECDAADGADAVALALALEHALPLLDALQAWLGAQAADAEPAAPAPWPAPDEALTIAAQGVGRVALPWRSLPADCFGRPLQVSGLTLVWPEVPCELLLATFAADRIEAHQLVPGAMLLLPQTFTAPSTPLALTARPQGAAPLLGGLMFDIAADCWHAAPTVVTAAPPPDDDAWHLLSASPFAPSASCWFGDAGATTAWPPLRTIALRRRGHAAAVGRLAAVGTGWGLLIEDAPAAARAA